MSFLTCCTERSEPRRCTCLQRGSGPAGLGCGSPPIAASAALSMLSQQPLSGHPSPSENGSRGRKPAPGAAPENGGNIGAASRRPPSASLPGCRKGLCECWWQWPKLSKSLMLFPIRTGCSADSCPAVPLSPCVREYTPHKAAPQTHAHGSPHVREGDSRAVALSQTRSFCTDKETALLD